MNQDQRRRTLDQIAAEVAACRLCPLHAGRTNAVPGEGNPETEVVFVGEGPGFNEDQQGRPFVGAAGGLLNELLRAIGWRREEVFITNVVKCRPPQNRDPEPAEIAACAPYLHRQLEALDPALIVTLGRHSLQTFMPGARISAAHGTVKPVDPATGASAALSYAMYHPAAALRANSLRETMLEDMAGIPQVLIDARARRDLSAAEPVADAAPHAEAEAEAEAAAGAIAAEVEADLESALVTVAALPEPSTDDSQTTLFG